MLNKLWFGHHRLYWLLLPFSWIYGGIVALRRFLYQHGWIKSWKAPIPIVVVGNLTVGGNGKTPLVIWLVEQLTQKGIRVGVVSRGYGSQSNHYPLIITNTTLPQEGGDEPVLIYRRTQVPVAISPKRVEAVQALIKNYPLDLIITDDGLQHYALQRDYEIVVVDGQRIFGNGWWLPAGPMRERSSRLRSVNKMVINGKIGGQHKLFPVESTLQMNIVPTKIINLQTREQIDFNMLKKCIAIAGIGNPPRFFALLCYLGIAIDSSYTFSDHHVYTQQELLAITPNDQPLIMTEKDAVKCLDFARPNWWYLSIDIDIDKYQAATLINEIEQLLSNRII